MEDQTVFFILVDHKHFPDLFQKSNIRTIPALIHIKPHRKGNTGPIFTLEADSFALNSRFSWSPEGLANFVRDRAGVKFKMRNPDGFQFPGWGRRREGGAAAAPSAAGCFLVLGFLCLAGFLPYTVSDAFRDSGTVTFLAVTGLLWLFTSGLWYSFVTSATAFVVDEHGLVLIHPKAGEQYGLEGVIMSGLSVLVGLAVLAVNVWLPAFHTDHQTKTRLGLMLVTSVLALFYLLRSGYIAKNRDYLAYAPK